jgi:proteasome lid subunit RPN8/RPN11
MLHDGTRHVIDILVVDNAKAGDKTRRFEISPQDYMTAEAHALEHDWTLLGIYHSHPKHPAIPSETDRLSAQPYFSYVIISVLDADTIEFRSWLLNEEQQFEEEEVTDYQYQ